MNKNKQQKNLKTNNNNKQIFTNIQQFSVRLSLISQDTPRIRSLRPRRCLPVPLPAVPRN